MLRIKRLAIAVIGSTLLLVGAALLILPGPGLLVISIGLAILATEFVWARALLKKARAKVNKTIRGDGTPKASD